MAPDATWNWLDLNFPWVGLGVAIVLAVFMFATNRLRHDMMQTRWPLFSHAVTRLSAFRFTA